MMLSVVI